MFEMRVGFPVSGFIIYTKLTNINVLSDLEKMDQFC